MSQAATTNTHHQSNVTLAHSCYGIPDGETLRLASGEPAPPLAARVHAALRALILDPEFPCVSARSAMNQSSYRFGMYSELASVDASGGLAEDLSRFIGEQPSMTGDFTTFIASFDAPKMKDGIEFERLLWDQLAQLHARDRSPWAGDVSRDVTDPRFSFSFAGTAFFVVGLAPSGTRWARTFPWPTLAFNTHEQFERLRREGQFQRIREVTRQRDVELEGDVNPNLADFGEHTEARQYSGREVEADWRCPVNFGREDA